MPGTSRPSAAIPPLLKQLNERAVLETIRDAAPISRAEISRRAGISKPTVSLALQSLVGAGLVRQVDHDGGGPSYGATFFEPVPDAALVVGFDVGARFLRGAVCDLAGRVRARHDVPLSGADATGAIEAIAGLQASLLEAAGLPAQLVDGVSVGVPGVVDGEAGTVRLAANVPGLEERPFGPELARRLGCKVTLENDINLAALGEAWQGVAAGVEDFAFLSVGTGLGMGLVLGGELHRGRHGAAGELDYAFVGLDVEVDPCADAVSTLAARLVTGAEPGSTELQAPFDARSTFAAARRGDPVATAVAEQLAWRIALQVCPVAAVADVALLVIGGGIGANGDLLLDPIRRLLARWLPYPPRVELSSLGEAAVLTGALAVALRAARENVFANRHGG